MRLIKSFGFAVSGIKYCLQEANFKIHIGLAVMAVVLGFILGISPTEWIVIAICIAAVLAFEMLNTAIERLCNIVYPGFNAGIKMVKDVSAGAVLLIAIMAAVCGAIIFVPKIFLLIKNI